MNYYNTHHSPEGRKDPAMTYHDHMSMEEIKIQDEAIALYDGGWRAEDRDQMIEEYGLTSEHADKIVEWLEEIAAGKVMLNGEEVNWDDCVELMDDDIRETIHAEGITNQEFLGLYCKAHREKYGEKFEI